MSDEDLAGAEGVPAEASARRPRRGRRLHQLAQHDHKPKAGADGQRGEIVAGVKYALHGYVWIRSRLGSATKSPQRWGAARAPHWAASWRTAARPQS
jgi:hypothetical protein